MFSENLYALDRNIWWDEAAEREDRRVVAFEVVSKKAPDLGIGLRGVDVAAPDPPRCHPRVSFGDEELREGFLSARRVRRVLGHTTYDAEHSSRRTQFSTQISEH